MLISSKTLQAYTTPPSPKSPELSRRRHLAVLPSPPASLSRVVSSCTPDSTPPSAQEIMEVVTEDLPRIKFRCERQGDCAPLALSTPGLQELMQLCQRMEELGAAPVLNDGLVGGNAGLLVDAPDINPAGPTLFVTRSGKPPALHMGPEDFVAVTGFEKAEWSATYRSANPEYRPSSDTPLLIACLSGSSAARHHWKSQPQVALHGHALAEGAGLEAARSMSLPISEHATLFSTPPDLQELEGLLTGHPFPEQRCFIRRGHGFFILGEDVKHAEETFEEFVVPYLMRLRQEA